MVKTARGILGLLLASALACGVLQGAARINGLVALPESSNAITILRGGEQYLAFRFAGWGPGWQYLGFRGDVEEDEKASRSRLTSSATVRSSGAVVRLDIGVSKSGPRELRMETGVRTDTSTRLTQIIVSAEIPLPFFAGGKAVVEHADGASREVALPLGRKGLGKEVRRFTLVDRDGRRTVVSLEPPTDVTSDGDARILLAGARLEAERPRKLAVTVEFPQELTYFPGKRSVPGDPDMTTWYAFTPEGIAGKKSEISLAGWLETPAGKHGRIVRRGSELLYNGKPFKLWGMNVCYSACAPEKELGERRASFYAAYGINSVRLHKYADGPGWAGIQSKGSFAEFDPAALDRMDHFVWRLKEHGIYVNLSSTFGVKLGPEDRRSVPYMDEFAKAGGSGSRVATGHGSIFLSRELQDLQIRQVVKLLEHRNPYTGATYAEEPAVAVVELFNEDSALFYGTLSQLQKIPTLRRRAAKRFCRWLAERYGSKKALLAAWGEEALGSFANEGFSQESWEEETIVPAGNPWFYDPAQLAGSQKTKKARLLDTMLFLYELQNDFYARYVKAIRKAGYGGEILASNWQAGRAFSHYYNLHSDSLVGLIDRHNYMGGGSGGRISNATMLRSPGSGMLSAGMQQVADRPFMLSEWIHVFPNEWGVEGPAILGAYGMGLQGWDASYIFQNRDSGAFSDRIGRDRWDGTSPQILGVFPAVARQVLRGDAAESPVLATRRVHVPSLHEGKIGFEDTISQEHDIKTFDSDKVPAAALAAVRSVVEFTDRWQDTPAFDISRYRNGRLYTSSTGQLAWHAGASRLDGFFTLNSPATRAVVGFARDRTCALGNVTVTPRSRFSAIYVTARERDADIESSKNLLVVAIARARNTGMKVFLDSQLIDRGKPPILMEPVKAEISIRGKGRPEVTLLDHDGCRTPRKLTAKDGTFTIDGARDRTCYYLVSFHEDPVASAILRAGNADDDGERLACLEELRKLPDLSPSLRRDLDRLTGEIERWIHAGRLDYFGRQVSRAKDYDFGIAADSPLQPLTYLYRGRMLTWYTLESGGVWNNAERRREFLDRARGFFEKAARAFPENRIARMYLGEPTPPRKLYPPAPGAPAWAVLEREAIERVTDIIEWWIDHRMRENGEYGGGWGDDCEMWRWWVPVLIGFESPRINQAQARFSAALLAQPHMKLGYTTRMSDVEHTAEDSADAITPMMHIEPQDAAWRQRALRLADFMKDLWTGTNERGFLQFKSTYFTAREVDASPRRACDTVYHPRAVQPALLYWQRTGDARLTRLFASWMDTWVDAAARAERGKPAGILPSAIHWPDGRPGGLGENWWDPRNHGEYTLYLFPSAMHIMTHTLLLTHHMTGKPEYLEPIRSMARARLRHLRAGRPQDLTPGSEAWCASRLGGLSAVAAKYRLLTGGRDLDELLQREMPPYMRLRLEGDEKALLSALQRTVEALRINFEGYTSEVRYTDRVLRFPSLFGGGGMPSKRAAGIHSPHTDLLYSCVSGDPGEAGYCPLNAVRWLTPPRDIAALVVESGRKELAARLFHFGKRARKMSAELYLLEPGKYEFRLVTGKAGESPPRLLDGPRGLVVDGPRTRVSFVLPPRALCTLRVSAPSR